MFILYAKKIKSEIIFINIFSLNIFEIPLEFLVYGFIIHKNYKIVNFF